MKKILHIISSPRSGAYVSIKLGNAIIEKIQTALAEIMELAINQRRQMRMY